MAVVGIVRRFDDVNAKQCSDASLGSLGMESIIIVQFIALSRIELGFLASEVEASLNVLRGVDDD